MVAQTQCGGRFAHSNVRVKQTCATIADRCGLAPWSLLKTKIGNVSNVRVAHCDPSVAVTLLIAVSLVAVCNSRDRG